MSRSQVTINDRGAPTIERSAEYVPDARPRAMFAMSVAGDEFAPAAVRAALARWWDVRADGRGGATDLDLVVSELVTNAVEAARGDRIDVAIRLRSEGVQVSVTNRLVTWDPDSMTGVIRDPLAERGRGLFIVRSVADSVSMQISGGFITVTATVSPSV
jgi:anti-sigma regulatory factor (Ser/Thr protein kinase)